MPKTPQGIAADPDGSLLKAEKLNDRVCKVNATGMLNAFATSDILPSAAAAGPVSRLAACAAGPRLGSRPITFRLATIGKNALFAYQPPSPCVPCADLRLTAGP